MVEIKNKLLIARTNEDLLNPEKWYNFNSANKISKIPPHWLDNNLFIQSQPDLSQNYL